MGIVFILLVIIGIVILIKPSILWQVTESWKSDGAERPSDLYKLSTRFGGIMMSIAGLSGVVAIWFL
ncbi:hypothetical protein H8B09_07170 [Paenibacillus sp. PR3]|uniref:DUF6199 domain-containing protein n=1 Tax=Paenibacillus terricola TaxID=2763503 RepID=A0ABR8MRH4_9BACL|nr:DUF6199 family natural product biosynthesis protein [Paenibacillus terricola]MBD3918528.1 hypothetical protein [Paenibacillus terricola]